MKITSQIIGVRVLLTFAVLLMAPQQMFAHLKLVSCDLFKNDLTESHTWKSVIITEIMADPSPPQALAEVEYIEIFNRSAVAVQLNGWQFSDASTAASLTDFVLEPNAYVVVASKAVGNGAANMLVISGLPSLNNAGDSLALKDPNGIVTDIVNYSLDWYRDTQRNGGGWSLELIDPENTCAVDDNWRVTEDDRGGTPGEPNSIMASNPDVVGPHLVSVTPVDLQTLRLTFNEKLAAGTLSTATWTIVPALEEVRRTFADSSRTAIDVHLSESIAPGILYSVSIESAFDCAGNAIPSIQRASFALPERASPGDVVINEVLFNPFPDGEDYVEVFNASGKYIDLNGWAIGSSDDSGNIDKSAITKTIIVGPDGYIVFSSDLAKLWSHYPAPDSSSYALDLPAYGDDTGTITVFNEQDTIIDQFSYTAGMHNAFVRNPEGVSLERISAAERTNDSANWTSASSISGFGTPGLRNSAARLDAPIFDRPVRVVPQVFTPITGQPGSAGIFYHFQQAGSIATVNICDSRGAIVRHLANNLLLGTEGILRWEGDNDDGSKVLSGYYLVWFQVFDTGGSSSLYRESVAVSARF